MNQLYVILGAPLWRILGKKVGLWYAHGTVSNSLRLAVFWATTIFTSTEEGMRIQTSKREIVGQGIDTDLFCLGDKKPSDVLRLITVGRISQSKNLETLIRASALLKEKGFLFSFSIVGNTLTEKDIEYKEKLKNLCAELHVEEHIQWAGSVTQKQLPALLQQSDIFIHDGATNSLDKALLEASLCGCIVVSSNPAYLSILNEDAEDFIFTPQNSKMLTNKIIKSIRNLPERIAEQTKSYHTVSRLIFSIIKKLTIKSH
jgi:glycosyltransferase involved in cell wall biosynthesis